MGSPSSPLRRHRLSTHGCAVHKQPHHRATIPPPGAAEVAPHGLDVSDLSSTGVAGATLRRFG